MRLLFLLLLPGCIDFDRLGTLYQPPDLGADLSMSDLSISDLAISDLAELDFQMIVTEKDLSAADL